jgi:hypothetical protein
MNLGLVLFLLSHEEWFLIVKGLVPLVWLVKQLMALGWLEEYF